MILEEPIARRIDLRLDHFDFVADQIRAAFADRPTESVSTWCQRELRFDEPDNRGRFSIAGRDYIREPLDTWADPLVSDLVLVWGSQSGKTGVIMGGAAWTAANEPARLFWVMPTRPVVLNFSKSRWQPLLRASPGTRNLIPRTRQKDSFSNLNQVLGNASVDFVWSNSPAALSSVPARVTILDEIDKFPMGTTLEADAVNLAEQRTKSFGIPKRIKTSTPTLEEAPAWQEFEKSDKRRRFWPCPFCGKQFVLAWSKDFTVFKLTGEEAFVVWDKEAKRTLEGGRTDWDLDRVERSARFVCPHCAGHVQDAHKTKCDRDGVWRPTAVSARGFRGFHLPSLYASSPQTAVSALAVKFLQAKRSLMGLQGFVNGDLAEPWSNQESRAERIEIIAPADAPPLENACRTITGDYQAVAPKVWFVARDWLAGNSRLVDFGPLDSLDELREKQLELKVPDNQVGVDSGFAAEEVYSYCLKFGKLFPKPNSLPVFVGWVPMKGFERRQQWRDPRSKTQRPFNLGSAALPHRRFRLPLLEFSTDHLKDILDRLRRGKTGFAWEVSEQADDVYFRHLDADKKEGVYSSRTNRVSWIYRKRARTWPDHLRDCEVESVALALFYRALPWGETENPKGKPDDDRAGAPDV